jgi:ppGpp synthetase/RelA/SpoT-type nucleotidyltranferase
MDGINFVTNTSGAKTAIMIDFAALRQHSTSGREVVQYLSALEDIEDIIDVELSRIEPSESWHTVKRRLKSQHKLSEHV